MVVDAAGNLHVADSGNYRVQWLGGDGKFLAEWAIPEPQGAKFQSPQALAMDSQGFLYVSDAANSRIYKLEIIRGVAK